MSLLLKKSFVF